MGGSEADASSQSSAGRLRTVSATCDKKPAKGESNLGTIRCEVDRARELLGLPPRKPAQQRASLATQGVVAQQGLEPSAPSLGGQVVPVPDAARQLPSADLPAILEVAGSSQSLSVNEGKSESESTREPPHAQGELPAADGQVLSREEQKMRLKEEVAALRRKVHKAKNDILSEKHMRGDSRSSASSAAGAAPEAALSEGLENVFASDTVPLTLPIRARK